MRMKTDHARIPWNHARLDAMALTYNEAQSLYNRGYMSDTDWARYQFVWTWSAPRYSGLEGMKQDRVFERLGYEGLLRRINRVRKCIGLRPI